MQEGSEYSIRSSEDGFYSDEILAEAFAHYRGRELLAGVQRSLWFFYTHGANDNIYYSAENSNPENLSQANFGAATKEYWDTINTKLWDDTEGQAAWLEATGKNYKPCFSGGNDVPIGDWLAPEIGDKVHTLNSDDSALVTVSGVFDPETPFMSWEFAGSGIKTVEVEYTTDEGETWTTLETEFDGTNYVSTIPAVEEGTTVHYYSKAQDNFNNWTAFPEGAEEWDNQGNSISKSISNSQLYNASDPDLIDFQGTADEVPEEPAETPEVVEVQEEIEETPEETPVTQPVTPQGGEDEPTVNPVSPQAEEAGKGAGGIGAPLIRTGGLDL